MLEIDEAELKQLKRDNRVFRKKLQRAQKELARLEQIKQSQESLHRQVILELEDSQTTLELQKQELEQLLEDLKKTQNKLLEAEKLSALGRLVAGVAHEINTPLGTSITLASTLVDETDSFRRVTQSSALKRSQLNHYIDIAQDSTQLILHNLNRAGELIKTFKQVAVDQSHHDHRQFEVMSYLAEVGKSLMTYVDKHGHQFTIEESEPVYIDGYPGLFAQIITNLVMNSLSHAFKNDESGSLTLSVDLQETTLHLTYSDNGCGIPKELLGKVYEPFFTTARDAGGTGLGLHIVYNIVTQKLNGDIQLSSVLGEGTQFKIAIPVQLAPQT